MHEPRGTMDQNIQGLTPSSLSYGPSSSSGSSGDDAPHYHLNRRNGRHALVFTLVMFFVAAAAIFLAGGNKERADSTFVMQVPVGLEIGGHEAASTAAPSESTPKPTNSPVISYTPTLANVTSSSQQPTEQYVNTESPAPTMHPHHSPRHTDSPTHKHHHSHPVDHRPTYKPTSKPTHKRHTHSDTIMSPTPPENVTQHPSMHTESPSAPPSSQVNDTSVPASDSDPIRRILPSALATIEKSNPDFKLGGREKLSVEGDERISFLHFNLTSISNDVVARATLNLHLTARDNDISDIAVRVDMLPHVWAWNAGSVSWNEPLKSEEPFTVGYLSPVGYLAAAPLASKVTEQLYEVDVTSAIVRAHQDWVTFRLSTESSGRLWFASEEWNGGELVPELAMTLSA